MPTQFLPLTGLDQTGVIFDNPPVSLPPQAFSDARNVRFKDGSVRKMEGEIALFTGLLTTDQRLKYVAWWANPNLAFLNRGYYVLILEETVSGSQMDQVYIVEPGDTSLGSPLGSYDAVEDGLWQHTFFQGGFCLILNNTLSPPVYLIDDAGNLERDMVPNLEELPGWDSYNVPTFSISDIFNEATNTRVFDTNTSQSLILDDNYQFSISLVPPASAAVTYLIVPASFEDTDVVFFGLANTSFVSIANPRNTVISFADTDLPDQTEVSISLESPPVNTTAGIVRSFGDFLVAGNLREVDDEGNVVRNLPGVVRSSDVALPGEVPANWNPFAVGVSTADEFIIADTGIVQDMAELQGNFFIYSNTSISVMRLTGNAVVPLTIAPITDSYGAQTTGSVLEFDGRHFVVGSQDIYLFAGHPGSIQSISDSRVRRYFFDNLNPLQDDRLFVLRYQQRDEIWVCFPTRLSISGEADQALIWNYRTDVWTVRDLNNVISGDIGPVPGGGVPNSSIVTTGDTGDNVIAIPGQPEIQTFSSTGFDLTIPDADTEVRTITVNIPSYTAEGPEIFDLELGEDFNSGVNTDTDQPLSLVFTASNQGVFLPGFPFIFVFPENLTAEDTLTAQASVHTIVAALNADPTFGIYYTAIADEIFPRAFRIESTSALTEHDVHTLEFNADVTNRDLLEASNAGSDSLTLTDQSGSDGTFNEFFPESFVGHHVFVDGDSEGVDLPANVQVQMGTQDSETELFFQFLADTDLFYHGGSGVVDTDESVYTNIEVTFESILEPFFVTEPGNMQFKLVDTDGNGVADTMVTFVGFLPASSSSASADITIFNRPGGENEVGTPPIIQFQLVTLSYDSESDSLVAVHSPEPEFELTLSGDFSSDEATRNNLAAIRIANAFNATDGSGWTATFVDNVVTLSADSPGPRDFFIDNVVPFASGIDTDNFTIATTKVGVFNYGATEVATGDARIIFPEITLTPPIEEDPALDRDPYTYRVNPNGMSMDFTDSELVAQALLMASDNFDTWRVSDTELSTVNVDTEILTQFAQRPILHLWENEVARVGNVTTVIDQIDRGDTNIFSVSELQDGRYHVYAVPTYIGVVVSLGPDAYEVIILRGLLANSSANVLEDWATRLATANQRLLVAAEGNSLNIQPINYDDLANFVLEVYFNNTQEGADNIQRLFDEASAGMITLADGTQVPATLNPFSNELFINPGRDTLAVNTDAANGDPGFGGGQNISATVLTDFDVVRPWPTNEINPNQEYPLFATRVVLNTLNDQGVATGTAPYNRIVGADLGFNIPDYSSMSDTDVTAYTSYIERLQMPISPEFITEELRSIALWADGSTVKQYRSQGEYNKLDVFILPTNDPGHVVDLTDETNSNIRRNLFEVSEEYKIDMRAHGRLFNIRITDNPTDERFESTPLLINGKVFDKETEWRVSGLQLEVKAGGRR